eukprot:2384498-Pyramimonas_sp.AAC.1
MILDLTPARHRGGLVELPPPRMVPTRPQKDATGNQAWEAPKGHQIPPPLLLPTLVLSAHFLK